MRWILLGLALIALFVGALIVANLTATPEPRGEPASDPVVLRPRATPEPNPPPPLRQVPNGAPPDAAAPAPPEDPFADADPSREGLEPEPDGGTVYPVSAKGIREVLLTKQAELSECYAKWLASTPNAPKRVMVSVKVMGIPDTERARIESVTVDEAQTSGHVQMGRCVKEALKALRFERPGGGWTTVAFPFKAR